MRRLLQEPRINLSSVRPSPLSPDPRDKQIAELCNAVKVLQKSIHEIIQVLNEQTLHG